MKAWGSSGCVSVWALGLVGLAGQAGQLVQAQTPPAAEPALTEPAAPWSLVIEATSELKALLAKHLDLARLPSLASGEPLGSEELERLINAAPQQAHELLQTEGYFDAKVQVQRVAGVGAGPQVLRMSVEPGARTRVRQLKLLLEGDLSRLESRGDPPSLALLAQLRSAWPLPDGKVFRNADWSDGKSAMLARLRSSGYALATFSGSAAQVDVASHAATLVLVIDSGPLFKAGEPKIEGLALHSRQTVLNLSPLQAGSVVTEAVMLDFQERLVKSGLFEQATVTLDADEQRAQAAQVVVRVREAARHQLTTGVGVSSNTGPRVTLEHIDRRAFARGLVARNKLEWGQQRQAWNGELSTHVLPDGYRWFTGLTIERLLTDKDTVLAQRVRLGRALEYSRIERSQFAEWDRTARRTDAGRSSVASLTVNQHQLWRSIDNPILPTDGQTATLQLAAGMLQSSDVSGAASNSPLARAHARITLYRPWPNDWYVHARLEAGQVFTKSAAQVSEHLGFRAGGDDSVRGYSYRSLGPLRDGAVASGKVLMGASAEVARPLGANWPSLWGAAFVDVGQAADTWRTLDPVVGLGLGLRWRSPVGPLRVDFAYGEAVRRWRLHFSVGIVL